MIGVSKVAAKTTKFVAEKGIEKISEKFVTISKDKPPRLAKKKIILQKFLSKFVHRRALDSPLAKLSSPLKTISSKQDHPKPQ